MPDQSFGGLLRAPVTDLPPIARAGVDLAKLVLWFIAIAILLLLALTVAEEFRTDGATNSDIEHLLKSLADKQIDMHNSADIENYQKAVGLTKDLISVTETARQSTRDFLMKISQLVLVSILLPVLTALLGYIFGTQQSAGASRESGK